MALSDSGQNPSPSVGGMAGAQSLSQDGQFAHRTHWLMEKKNAGWTYGETKDPVLKTHPCIVPFDQLPVEQQKKDMLFKAIIDVFID